MIKLDENFLVSQDRKSSKGNQNKWLLDDVWYKQDFLGYEGLSESVISKLIEKSNLKKFKFVKYECEEIMYLGVTRKGCSSSNFLKQGERLITINRLFEKNLGRKLQGILESIPNGKDKIEYVTSQVILMTGLKDFGKYLNVLFSIDALFLNEDRHFHNIALIIKENGEYDYCPIFDNGSGLLSDTRNDYPLNYPVKNLIEQVRSKPFTTDFEKQLKYTQELYGQNIIFDFDIKDVEEILNNETNYSVEIKNRIIEIMKIQINKYQDTLFRK